MMFRETPEADRQVTGRTDKCLKLTDRHTGDLTDIHTPDTDRQTDR